MLEQIYTCSNELVGDDLAELLTLTVEVDIYGNIKYHNHLGEEHRVHGPAVIFVDGTIMWCQCGHLHRLDGPAIIWDDGSREWFINGDQLTEEEFNERIK